MFRCQVCDKPCFTDTEMGNHLRIHGVNLFPEVLKLNALIEKIATENRAMRKHISNLESRLRIITP